ncbi:orf104b (mitochondrion) [Beta vulgaris subsp. vulgaris]|uniref:Orf104b protein n=1 Tax=Beta vulgaris subsp. vulgaris TaxID=3555 RepID=Q9MFC3_BETVV|nr:orf104b [Beta vulgaris subsp. vulgaris]BAA99319.1 orf104b [Beta vulgaris subsp. vulgaris]
MDSGKQISDLNPTSFSCLPRKSYTRSFTQTSSCSGSHRCILPRSVILVDWEKFSYLISPLDMSLFVEQRDPLILNFNFSFRGYWQGKGSIHSKYVELVPPPPFL